MNDTWEARFVDKHMDRAWLDLRLRLADRLVEGLADGLMEQIDITTATGETLSVSIADHCVVVVAGDEVYSTENVDEAAHAVFHVLHDEWQVVHPVFLDTELVEVPTVEDNEIKAAVPVLGRADSRDQLHAWVEAALGEWINGKVKVAPNGSMPWCTRGGNRAVVEVRNPGRIELLSVLARRVSFRRAHEVMDELSRKWFGLKFFLVQDTLMMSQTVIAHPFAADQLTTALGTFMNNRDQLAWVEDKVLSKRARVDRTMIEGLKKAHDEAQAALAEAAQELQARAERLEVADDTISELSEMVEEAQSERDAAKAELARLKQILERALGGQRGPQTFRTSSTRGEAA